MCREFVSFPKSGRSWLRYALVQLGLKEQIVFHHDGFEYNDGSLPALDFDFNARLLRCQNDSLRVYLHRDPRDVIVSLYFQITGRFSDFFQYREGISDFIRHPYFGAENLREFQRQWDDICSMGLALRISYEDCHRDFAGVLRIVLDHYDLQISSTAVAAAAKEARFDNMRTIEQGGVFDQPWLRLRNGAPKVRVGRVGGFRDVLSLKDQGYLNSIFNIID
jgi:hypothetical protein